MATACICYAAVYLSLRQRAFMSWVLVGLPHISTVIRLLKSDIQTCSSLKGSYIRSFSMSKVLTPWIDRACYRYLASQDCPPLRGKLTFKRIDVGSSTNVPKRGVAHTEQNCMHRVRDPSLLDR